MFLIWNPEHISSIYSPHYIYTGGAIWEQALWVRLHGSFSSAHLSLDQKAFIFLLTIPKHLNKKGFEGWDGLGTLPKVEQLYNIVSSRVEFTIFDGGGGG